MQFKILAIPATGDHEAEEELNRFLRGHRVISVQKQLAQTGTSAYWCFCAEYLDGVKPNADRSKGRHGRRVRLDAPCPAHRLDLMT